MIKKILAFLSVPVALILAFSATSFAAGTASPEDGTLLDHLKPLMDAITGKQWWLAGAIGLVAGLAALKKYAPEGKVKDFVNGDAGGAMVALGVSFGGALVASLSGATPTPMSAALAWDALQFAVGVAGGYTLIKKLLVDPLLNSKWYAEKAPAWVKAILSVATWAFTKPDVAKEAAAAGEAAVVAKPAEGVEGVVGKSTEL